MRRMRLLRNVISGRARGLDHLVRAQRRSHRFWLWAIPVGGFVLCASILIVAGVLSGVWAAEYIPVALFEGLVICGLFVACLAPVTDMPDNDHGGGGPHDDPPAPPPPFDPTMWVTLLSDDDGARRADADANRASHREPAGARH
jgi:hypothetical protein